MGEPAPADQTRGPFGGLVGCLGVGEGGQTWSPMNIHDPALEAGFLRCIFAKLSLDKVMSFSRGQDTAVSSAVLSSPSRL